MADDDGSRRPPQAYATVSPAGVGTTTSNQVSPGNLQDILDTGDPLLIDRAMDQMGVDDLTAYLESLPSPSAFGAVSPAGVGSQASRTPSTGARTPHRGSPLLSSGARTPHRGSPRLVAAAGAGGGGGGSSGSGRSTPRGRPGRGRGRGRRGRRRPQPSSSLPCTPPRPSRQATSRGSPPRTLNQADLQRRLRMLLQDQEQLAQEREIANVTMTNSIVTSYKQGGRPTVQSDSSRFST